MPGNPFQKPYRSPGRTPKAGRPARPKVSRTAGSSQMPGVSKGRVQPTVTVKPPRVRVTSKDTHPKSMKISPALGGAHLGTPGKTGVTNPKKWE